MRGSLSPLIRMSSLCGAQAQVLSLHFDLIFKRVILNTHPNTRK